MGEQRSGWAGRTIRRWRGRSVRQDPPASVDLSSLGRVVFGPGLVPSAGTCHVCGASSTTTGLTVVVGDRSVPMLVCGCGSWFFPGATAPDYEVVEDEESFHLRVDQAESIDAGAYALFQSSALADRAVVDIGSGIGLTSDLARWLGREVDSFDPSTAARLSVERLGIPIHLGLADVDSVHVPHPRLVFASEVIEHIDDPAAFVRLLRDIAGDDGYAILTTPSVAALGPEVPIDRMLATLALGQHLFLCSAASLERLVRDNGFAWVEVIEAEGRLVAVAGPSPVPVDGGFSRSRYLDYLMARHADVTRLDQVTRCRLFGYRLLKELVHSGRYAEAQPVLDELVTTYRTLGLDLLDPSSVVQRYAAASGPQRQLPPPATFPFNVPVICFLLGTLAIAVDHDGVKARRYFDAAIALADLYRRVAATGLLQLLDLEVQCVRTWAQESIALHGL